MVHPAIRGLALLLLLAASPAAGRADEDVWTGVERVVAVGDVHGDFEQFCAVLRSAGVIDDQGKWSGGKTHLVQTGDILDRGAGSRQAMDLLMRLEEEARRAGGAVHALIGNHEAMNVYGDLRYVFPGEFAAFRDADSEKTREAAYQAHQKELQTSLPPGKVPKFDDAYRKAWESQVPLGFVEHRRALGPNGKYGKWIRSHNAVLKIDGTLFLHGGISPKYAAWTVRQINDRIRAELETATPAEDGILLDPDGPLWYRGLARGDEKTLEPRLRTILENFKIERIVIGHTFTEGAVISRLGAKVLMIDVGLSRYYDPNGRIACLVVEQGKPHALHRGKRLEFPSDGARDRIRYLKEAAALDPPPSPLRRLIEELERNN